jgi:4'-phosphopantetheinyl transferase
MPLQKIEMTALQSGWGLWQIAESDDALTTLCLPEICPSDITSPIKRMEWATGRILMRRLVDKAGLQYKGLGKTDAGKPYLNDHPHHVSLSHSYPFVVAQLDLLHPVGIDIEQPKTKLLKIAHRVFMPAEVKDAGDNIIKNCIYWCGKEALYKVYGHRGISFYKDLTIQPFSLMQQGDLLGSISVNGAAALIALRYEVEKEFVVVFSKSPLIMSH